MKTDISITQMAQELERQRAAKRDFVAPTERLVMAQDAKSITIGKAGEGVLTRHAERQLASKLAIPVSFYERMRDNYPDTLSVVVNRLFQGEGKKVMVRMLDDKVRAFVSDRYRPLDNYDLFEAVIPSLLDAGVTIESCSLTETKLYIKALAPWLDRELPIPPGLTMGVGHNFFVRKIIGALTISNSEVGAASLSINPGFFEKQCTNMATFRDEGFGKMHIGGSTAGDDVSQYYSDDTRRLSDAVIWAKARDVVKASLDGRVLDSIVEKLLAARGDRISGNPNDVVEIFGSKKGFTEDEKGGLLRYLVDSGEMTRYGLQWAVTRLANDAIDYDRASELERLGGEVIELPRSEWQTLAKAA